MGSRRISSRSSPLAEDLITLLSAWREFPVIARNSSFTYKGRPVDVKQVSRELGVRYVVEGSVRKAADRVRINAQLIDATTGAHVWANRYDRKLEDIFAIQDEITTAIAGAMGAELAATEEERAARRPTQDLTAYDLLMQGRWYYSRGWVEGEPQQLIQVEARSLFERAIEIDPRFAAAFAWLALTYVAEWYVPIDSPGRALEEAERAARRSLLLDPELPVGHYAIGFVHQIRGELGETLAAVRQAIELDPSFAFSYRLMGFSLAEGGKPDEAIAVLEKGMRVSPRDPWLSEFIRAKSHAHFAAGRYVEAVECAKQSIAQGAPLYTAWLVLAASQAQLGEIDEAKTALREGQARTSVTLTATELRRMFSYFDPDLLKRYIDGLRKAGLKE
jgi:TolB-like protein/Tfp pilus assembly protein PilF